MSVATHQLSVVDVRHGRNSLRPRPSSAGDIANGTPFTKRKLALFSHFLARCPYNEKEEGKVPREEQRKRWFREWRCRGVCVECVTALPRHRDVNYCGKKP